MNNPIKKIVEDLEGAATGILEGKLKGIISNATFYSLLDERGIPPKTQWNTVERVAQALGYKIVLQKVDEK